ncbi:MAG TPA: hypothetical protein VKX41_15935 [Alloacidobacterium sp.]|nr:hypothetical protein [Alloacidobacterium sp.]
MPYEIIIDAAQILRSTLHLLEHTQFPEKNSTMITNVVKQLRLAIDDLELAKQRLEIDGRAH